MLSTRWRVADDETIAVLRQHKTDQAADQLKAGDSWRGVKDGPAFDKVLDMVRAVRPEILDAIVQSIPKRRLGEATEIASIVSWLASDEAAFATGADFSLNGGLYMS